MAAEVAEIGVADLLDPNPDIHSLFMHYNGLYFEGRLGACSVAWSTSRMTLCAGICQFARGGGCAIRLSEPLLKYRSVADLKDTLLHEMIHAYLFLTNGNKDHDDHGPSFQAKMSAINNSNVLDFQKPKQGYHISVYHSFKDEVDKYRVHQWMCSVCGNVIKRSMNRAPTAADCRFRPTDAQSCLDPRCSWHMHERFCCGNYVKVAEPADYVDKRKRSKDDASKQINGVTCEGSKQANGRKCKRHAKVEANNITALPNVGSRLENFFATKGSQNVRENVNANQQGRRFLEIEDEAKFMKKDIEITYEGTETAPKSDTSHKEDSVEGKTLEICRFPPAPGSNARKRKKKGDQSPGLPNVIIGWNGWWAFEEEENEEICKLIDKRQQRRKHERAVGLVESNMAVNESDVRDAIFIDEDQYFNCEANMEAIPNSDFPDAHFQSDRQGNWAPKNINEPFGDIKCQSHKVDNRHELCVRCIHQNLNLVHVRNGDMMTIVGPSELSTGNSMTIRSGCNSSNPENKAVKHLQWKQHTEIKDPSVHYVGSSQSDSEAGDVCTEDVYSLYRKATPYQVETCVRQNSANFSVEQMAEIKSYDDITDARPLCSSYSGMDTVKDKRSSFENRLVEHSVSGDNGAASPEGHSVAGQTENIKKSEGEKNLSVLETKSYEKFKGCIDDADIYPKKDSSICCPFCSKILEGDINNEEVNQEINRHIDGCLSFEKKSLSFSLS